jgi:ATP-dependent RNA helicase SUPV3L1/SUV3
LSDALHDRLTQRFVDRRSAFLVRQLASDGELMASVAERGEVRVEGAYVGRLDGFRFVPDAIDGVEMKTVLAAANRVLRGEVTQRARRLAADPDDVFALDAAGGLRWRGGTVGRLAAGDSLLRPRVEPVAGDFLDGEARDKVRQRLQAFARAEIERRLAALFMVRNLTLGTAGRGLAFRLVEALGVLDSDEVRHQVASLDPADRAALGRAGVRFGSESVFIEPLLRAEAMRCRALLWAVRHGRPPPALPPARRLGKAIEPDPLLPETFYTAIGLRLRGGFALRPDLLERIAATARRLARQGPFAADATLASLAGVEPLRLPALLAALGYRRAVAEGGIEIFHPKPRRRRPAAEPARRPSGDGHPFAKLRELKLA